MAKPAKSQRAKVLLYGTLPGNGARQLADALDLLHTDDYGPLPSAVAPEAPEIRGIALGIVRGHASKVMVNDGLFAMFPRLEIAANFGVGYEHIDVPAAVGRRVVVTHTPDVLTEEVADTAMGLLIATVRRLPQADRFLRAGKWAEGEFPLGATLRGRHLGIVGLGRIGKAVARRAAAFGLEVVYHGRHRQGEVAYRYFGSLLEMAEYVDTLMLCVPGGDSSRALVGAEVLAALGPDGVLINMARGSVIDEDALIQALRSRTILTAGLDVFPREPQVSPELLAMDNIVLLPHLGSSSLRTRFAMAQLCVDNLVSWFSGKGALTPVPGGLSG